jgi:hypothetical protein
MTGSKVKWLNLQLHPTVWTTGLTIRSNGQQCPTIQHTVQTRTRLYTCVLLHYVSTATNNSTNTCIYQFTGDMTDERQNLASDTNKDLLWFHLSLHKLHTVLLAIFSSWTSWPVKMGLTHQPETLVKDNHMMLCNIPEVRRPHQIKDLTTDCLHVLLCSSY